MVVLMVVQDSRGHSLDNRLDPYIAGELAIV
jgi:hypothetical protein